MLQTWCEAGVAIPVVHEAPLTSARLAVARPVTSVLCAVRTGLRVTVRPTRLAVPEVRCPTPAAVGRALAHVLVDDLASVLYLNGDDPVACVLFTYTKYRHSRELRAGVNAYLDSRYF